MTHDRETAESWSRRRFLGSAGAGLCAGAAIAGQSGVALRLARFSTEITPPLGHPLMGGGVAPAARIDDPLYSLGFVLLGPDRPIVLAALDWCEIRNGAYSRWREALAQAANTSPERVLVMSLHQHDAPIADLEAQRLLEREKAKGAICDLTFHERAVEAVARAVRASLKDARPVSHIGAGKAAVENVASNRRYLGDDGKPRFDRMSATREVSIRNRPEGTIDPFLRTLSFWDGATPLLALSCYATHPMSYYGKGGVSSDFVGLARKRRQADEPKLMQIYASGCSGNVTAGKFNDGSIGNRAALAERVYQAMTKAWQDTVKRPASLDSFRSMPLTLEPRGGAGFSEAELLERLRSDPRPFGQCLAALGLSWRKRVEAGLRLDVPALAMGNVKLLLLPAESYVEYQLLAQASAPDAFVLTMGYGECGPGYIPTERALKEQDSNLRDWCWVAPGCEMAMRRAIEAALGRK